MSVVSISLPSKMLEELETIQQKERYSSRSEIVREAIRDYLGKYRRRKMLSGELAGFLSILYEVSDKSCSHKISKLHHANEEVVYGAFHLHFDEENCLDIWLIRGAGRKIIGLIEHLKAVRGTKHVGEDLISI